MFHLCIGIFLVGAIALFLEGCGPKGKSHTSLQRFGCLNGCEFELTCSERGLDVIPNEFCEYLPESPIQNVLASECSKSLDKFNEKVRRLFCHLWNSDGVQGITKGQMPVVCDSHCTAMFSCQKSSQALGMHRLVFRSFGCERDGFGDTPFESETDFPEMPAECGAKLNKIGFSADTYSRVCKWLTSTETAASYEAQCSNGCKMTLECHDGGMIVSNVQLCRLGSMPTAVRKDACEQSIHLLENDDFARKVFCHQRSIDFSEPPPGKAGIFSCGGRCQVTAFCSSDGKFVAEAEGCTDFLISNSLEPMTEEKCLERLSERKSGGLWPGCSSVGLADPGNMIINTHVECFPGCEVVFGCTSSGFLAWELTREGCHVRSIPSPPIPPDFVACNHFIVAVDRSAYRAELCSFLEEVNPNNEQAPAALADTGDERGREAHASLLGGTAITVEPEASLWS